MLQAVAGLIKAQDPSTMKAMNGGEALASNTEPAQYFFVCYGLAFEVLADPAAVSTSDEARVSPAYTPILALDAIEGLIEPAIAGPCLLQDGLFEELCGLSYRLTLTQPPSVQARVVRVILQLARCYSKQLLMATHNSAYAHSL